MICRFCSQWSEEGRGRCPFCGNDPAGEVDCTVVGRIQLTSNQVARIPRGGSSITEEARALSRQFLGSGNDEPLPKIAVILMVGGVLAVVLGLLIRC